MVVNTIYKTSKIEFDLRNVSHIEKNNDCCFVIMKQSTYNAEKETWENAPMLFGEEMNEFLAIYNDFVKSQHELIVSDITKMFQSFANISVTLFAEKSEDSQGIGNYEFNSSAMPENLATAKVFKIMLGNYKLYIYASR